MSVFYFHPMTERQCPICKSDIYLNPDIVIYMSPCFHKICESCMYRIFSKGQAPCPECGTMLRKINYITPTFEDIQVEKECKVRRTLLKAFRREEEEFENEVGYNDYLEEFEDLVFELMELKSESLVRDRIKRIQDMGAKCILNPSEMVSKPKSVEKRVRSGSEDEEHKVQKTTDYFDPGDLPRIMTGLTRKVCMPEGFFKFSVPGGLTEEMIVSMAIASLSNADI